MRLFVALELPPAAREALHAWAATSLAPDPALRVVARENLHVTLVFLGWRGEDELATIATTALAPVRGMAAPTLCPEGVSGVPSRRPRLFAVDLGDPGAAAARVQGACERALAEAGLHEPEDRGFWAHVTVARVRRRANPLHTEFPPAQVPPFTAEAVVLYRSDIGRDGARYTALERVPLSAGAS